MEPSQTGQLGVLDATSMTFGSGSVTTNGQINFFYFKFDLTIGIVEPSQRPYKKKKGIILF
jgi:hypothetical protein